MVNDMKTKQREKAKKVGKSKVVAEVIRELENLQKAKKETLYDWHSFPVKKSHWMKAQWEDFVSITKSS